jgi:hypothetical protein
LVEFVSTPHPDLPQQLRVEYSGKAPYLNRLRQHSPIEIWQQAEEAIGRGFQQSQAGGRQKAEASYRKAYRLLGLLVHIIEREWQTRLGEVPELRELQERRQKVQSWLEQVNG